MSTLLAAKNAKYALKSIIIVEGFLSFHLSFKPFSFEVQCAVLLCFLGMPANIPREFCQKEKENLENRF